MITKKCNGPCGRELPLDSFNTRKGQCKKPITIIPRCKDCMNEYGRDYKKANMEKELKRTNAYNKRLRLETIEIYGGKCKCCGESRTEFLAFDHVNNDGNEHRKKQQSGSRTMVFWIRKNNYPNTIQLLCHNCNLGKAFYGECPHIKELQDLARNEQEIFIDFDCV